MGSGIGHTLVSAYLLNNAESAIQRDQALLGELKASWKKLEDWFASTAEKLNTTKAEVVQKLCDETKKYGGIALKYVLPFILADYVPTRSMTVVVGMGLTDVLSLWTDWATIKQLSKGQSKSQFSHFVEGFIRGNEMRCKLVSYMPVIEQRC